MSGNGSKRFRVRQRVGQYRIESCLAIGGFAEVYRAYDTIMGRRVALKIPLDHLTGQDMLTAFQHEVRIVGSLDHPNILPISTAARMDGRFVIVSPLAKESLADRLERRVGRAFTLDVIEQLLEGLAYAHGKKVIHCDVKPDNVLLFEEGQVRLADFGLARLAVRTIDASGSGTLGYMAPEQALGKPSPRSDVFSAGMILWRLIAGAIPEWPFHAPYPGTARARRGYSSAMIELAHRATDVEPRFRFSDARTMLQAFRRVRAGAVRIPAKRTSSNARKTK